MNEPNHSTFPSDNGGRMRDSLARLEAALAAGGIATWVIDPVTDRIVADASMARLFSVSPEEAATGSREPFLRAIHPDDRARAVAAVQEAIARLETYEVEYRVLLPNGSHRWVASRGGAGCGRAGAKRHRRYAGHHGAD